MKLVAEPEIQFGQENPALCGKRRNQAEDEPAFTKMRHPSAGHLSVAKTYAFWNIRIHGPFSRNEPSL